MNILKKIFEGQNVKISHEIDYMADATGSYEGYPVSCSKLDKYNKVVIHLVFGVDPSKAEALNRALTNLCNNCSNTIASFKDYAVRKNDLTVMLDHTSAKEQVTAAQTVLEAATALLRGYNCTAACEYCGENKPASFYTFGSATACLCAECYPKVVAQTKISDAAYKAIPVDYRKGTVAAFVTAILISVIYVWGLSKGIIMLSFGIPLLPFWAFKHYGKRIGKPGAIITTAICLIVFFFATKLGFAMRVKEVSTTALTAWDIFLNLKSLVAQYKNELGDAYNQYMLKGFGFSALVSVVIGAVILFSEGKTSIKKM